MAQEIGEQTKITLDLKTIGTIVGFTIALATTYFTLKSDIAIAMQMPEPEISSVEFKYKDEVVRSTIKRVEEKTDVLSDDVNEVKEQLNKIDQRLYELSKK